MEDIEKQLISLKGELETLISKFSGKAAVDIRTKENESIVSYNENMVFPTASTIKIFVLGAVLEQVQAGVLSLDDEITMEASQQIGGSGILKEFKIGSLYSIKDTATAMIVLSDNTATNMLIDLVGGVGKVNEHIRKHGLNETKLLNRIEFEAIGDDVHNLAVATANEFSRYLSLVLSKQVFNSELTEVMIDIMSRQQYLDQFPRYIPYNPYAKEVSVKQDIQIANKTGFFTGVRCDVGYLFLPSGTYIYSVLTKDCTDESFLAENEGTVFVGNIGKVTYEYIKNNL